MADLFLGWDVGAWNCDANRKSRDALGALELDERGAPRCVGQPWRGNLREILVGHEGAALIAELLRLLRIDGGAGRHVSIAIDAPLGWPRRMCELITRGVSSAVPEKADANPYLFRVQELGLFAPGRRPLSVVRDMIGSQSTKAIHFLQRAQVTATGTGVWRAENITALETYPAAAKRNGALEERRAQLCEALRDGGHSNAWSRDVNDAVMCALVAWLHRRHPEFLEAPGTDADLSEGWIWLPRDGGGATLPGGRRADV
jgi:hypothetical protein